MPRRFSAYGFHAERRCFLRVELADFRDVETVAAVVQQGRVAALGQPQACMSCGIL